MNTHERLKAAIAEHFIRREHVLYLRTRNPIHAWQAYCYARASGVPVPPWVLTYFDCCSERLIGATNNGQIAAAMDLTVKGGSSQSRQARTNARDFDIVFRFFGLKDRPTRQQMKAMGAPDALLRDVIDVRETDTSLLQQVADEYRLSEATVRDIVYAFGRSTR